MQLGPVRCVVVRISYSKSVRRFKMENETNEEVYEEIEVVDWIGDSFAW